MLQVGNIGVHPAHGSPPSLFPDAEGRTQFALWCILKSPLLIGTFLHNISEATLATLTDPLAISVNQDSLGAQGSLRAHGGWAPDKPRPTTNPAYGHQVWAGPLSGGRAAVVLANLDGNRSQPLTLTSDMMPAAPQGDAGVHDHHGAEPEAPAQWVIQEAFGGKKREGVTLPATAVVPPHDVAMWVLTPVTELPLATGS